MHDTEPPPDPALLVGTATGDDAAVWRLDARTALVFTADFFAPVVDDARTWGAIAAANALGDVYAMGGRPLLCLNLVGWPRDALPLDLLGDVLAGGGEVAREAGAIVAGGHTIDAPEPHYGMAVIGLAHPKRVLTNAAARPGDRLLLTKPVGTGVISTAIKAGECDPAVAAGAIAAMRTLLRGASEAAVEAGVKAATDVTGFGLLGHLGAMLAASGASAEVWADRVPVLPGARELADAGRIPGGSRRNRAHAEPHVSWNKAVAEADRVLLTDAQTAGGLLVSCPPRRLDRLAEAMAERGVPFAEIGRVGRGAPGSIRVRPAAR